jgi:hypothetical protein
VLADSTTIRARHHFTIIWMGRCGRPDDERVVFVRRHVLGLADHVSRLSCADPYSVSVGLRRRIGRDSFSVSPVSNDGVTGAFELASWRPTAWPELGAGDPGWGETCVSRTRA